jgi:hypothetical protein
MVEHVFGLAWQPRFGVLVAAAAEWRAELAVRRAGDARVKRAAVALVVDLLRGCPALWNLFGDGWAEPRRHSLIMQPFLISPIINVCDVLCAAELELARAAAGGRAPPDTADAAFLDACLRRHHPFPIFERFVAADVVVAGAVAVPARSQVIMFASDLAGDARWPVFGAGPRACAGAHLARPLLRALLAELPRAARFCPLRGHADSGRHNDGRVASLAEAVYFAATVARAICSRADGSGGGDEGGADTLKV